VTALQVDGNTYGRLISRGSSSGALDLIDSGAGTDEKWMQLISDGGITTFRSYSDTGSLISDDILVLDHSNGNVGIGTSAPVYQLQLSTNSAAKPGTAYWTVASDERLKDVNGDFTRGLDALDGLYPVYFNYKVGNAQNIPYDREYIGLIAQDVREVIPEAVVENQDGYLAIETDPILWTMLNSIKELALKSWFRYYFLYKRECRSYK